MNRVRGIPLPCPLSHPRQIFFTNKDKHAQRGSTCLKSHRYFEAGGHPSRLRLPPSSSVFSTSRSHNVTEDFLCFLP